MLIQTFVKYVFRNQMELWGDQMEQELSGALDAQTERGAAASLLALLPEEFTASELIKLRARKGQSVKNTQKASATSGRFSFYTIHLTLYTARSASFTHSPPLRSVDYCYAILTQNCGFTTFFCK